MRFSGESRYTETDINYNKCFQILNFLISYFYPCTIHNIRVIIDSVRKIPRISFPLLYNT
jgi:hypothetical protein